MEAVNFARNSSSLINFDWDPTGIDLVTLIASSAGQSISYLT